MSKTTLFDTSYQRRKLELLDLLLTRLRPIYTPEEIEALRIDAVDRQILSQRSGRGFVDRDLLETVLGNLLDALHPDRITPLARSTRSRSWMRPSARSPTSFTR